MKWDKKRAGSDAAHGQIVKILGKRIGWQIGGQAIQNQLRVLAMLKAKAGKILADVSRGQILPLIWLLKNKTHWIRIDGIREAAEGVGIKAGDHRPEAVRAQSEKERPADWQRSMYEAVSACRPARAHKERPRAAATDNHVTRLEVIGWDAMG